MELISSRDQSIVNEDRISELPEALIQQILSYLPTKIVVSTSLLSKQWRSHWKTVPCLKFSCDDHNIFENHKFSEIISKSFRSHKAPVLDSLGLKIRLDSANHMDNIRHWVGIAFARNLRELVLEVLYSQRLIFPESLCTCNTLVTLTLARNILVNISTPILFKSLRNLHLIGVRYKDAESICNLLSGCPILEKLMVARTIDDDVIFTIEVPSLKRLTIHDFGRSIREYVINAPSLNYFKLYEFKGFKLSLNAPKLLEASFIDGCYTINENFLGSLKSTKRLFFDLSSLKISYHPTTSTIFNQLVYLGMYTNQKEWCNLLRVMLNTSPKLQVLNLNYYKHYYDKEESGVRGIWNKPEHVPECLMSHLKTFSWKNYHCGLEEEKQVALYILKNARCLKNATFFINHKDPFGFKVVEKVKERCKMLINELANVTLASQSCQLVFKIE